MKTSEKLINDANRLIALAEKAKALVTANPEKFDHFDNGSSFGTCLAPTFFLHGPSDDVKPLCRKVGGNWTKQGDGSGRIDYHNETDGLRYVVFGAEHMAIEPLVI